MLPTLEPRAVEMIGFVAAVLTTVSFFPQVWRTWRSKSAGDLSLVTLILFTAGVSLWLAYGVAHRSVPIAAANAFTLVQSVVLIGLRVRYGRRAP